MLSFACRPEEESLNDGDLSYLSEQRIPPTEPEQAAQTFRVEDGFQMQLVAAEPLVTDPVALAYDENGLAYVAEMRDYPYADPATAQNWSDQLNQAPLGRVRVLKDNNADGTFDESFVFADSLSWPTGIAVWRGGIFVTAAPHLWYLKDTDGDGHADIRRKAFTGFLKYNIQATINNLRFGLDHKIYGAGSTNGGEIVSVGNPSAESVTLSRNDFRFDPVTLDFERLTGAGRYGHTFDDEGNRFIASPYRPFMHVVVPYRYLRRNPYVQIESALSQVADVDDETRVYKISPPQPWRAIRAKRRAASGSSSAPDRGFGHWTGASGSMLYRGGAYASEYRNNIFIGEVANNVIHRRTITPDGVSFSSARADSGAEFVASTDTWFRPVNMVNAPDGTLHVLDMYREFIEHPWSLPDDVHAQLDLTSGRDRGRIYRLAPPTYKTPPPPQLGSASTNHLVSLLEHPSSWWRTTAHRLLYERQDESAIPALRDMLTAGETPAGRLGALWSLNGLDALRNRDLLQALEDTSPAVRHNAVRLAETRLDTSEHLFQAVLQRAKDSALRVRYQAALTLGGLEGTRVVETMADLAEADADNRWMRTAVLTARPDLGQPLLIALLSASTFDHSEGSGELLRQLASVVGGRNRDSELQSVFDVAIALPPDHRDVVLHGLGSGLGQSGTTLRESAREVSHEAESLVDRAVDDARHTATDERAPMVQRTAAVHVMGYGMSDQADWSATFAPLLRPTQPMPVQEAVVRVVGRSSSLEGIEMLLDHWEALTPAIRSQAMGAFLQTPARVAAFLDAVKSERIPLGQINSTARSQLLQYSDSSLRIEAQGLFEGFVQGNRSEVIARYQRKLSLTDGDSEKGKIIYQSRCMSCHQFQGIGAAFGPPLETVQDKNTEELLTQIFDPNRDIAPGYDLYLLQLGDGRTFQGTITDESPTGITLKQPGGIVRTVLRKNIHSLSATGRSPMPEGLERVLTPEEANDLLVFILDS